MGNKSLINYSIDVSTKSSGSMNQENINISDCFQLSSNELKGTWVLLVLGKD